MSPTELPSNDPSQTPSQAPTAAPTYSPTNSPVEVVVNQGNIYLFYDEQIEELSLSLKSYSERLAQATVLALRKVLTDTGLHTVCNDSNTTNCDLTNFNPWTNGQFASSTMKIKG